MMNSDDIDKKQVVEQVKKIIEGTRGEFPILKKLDFVVYDVDDTGTYIKVIFKCEANVYQRPMLREECRRLIRLLYAKIPDLIELGLDIKVWDVGEDMNITSAFVCGLTIIDKDFYKQVN